MSDGDGLGAIPRTLRDGRYALGPLLGQGGMAVVVMAHDNELGVDRAVKLLSPRGDSRETLRRRLRAEARAMARLNHPNILSVHDVGSEGELDWVVMDLAEGGSLQDLVQHGPMAPALAVHHMVQVLSALQAAHAEGVVHRDVKPHNVLLDKGGRALLADFGIALLAGDDRRTRSGVAMGSLAFMPPEQRLDASRVGPAADVYAVGSTLYNLLTGSNPVDLFLADADSPRWTGVPPELAEVLRRACAMRPEDRYPDAAAMQTALTALMPRLETLPVPPGITTVGAPDLTHAPTRPAAPPTTLAPTAPTAEAALLPTPPSRAPLWVVGGLTLVAAVLIALLLLGPTEDPVPADPSAGPEPVPPVLTTRTPDPVERPLPVLEPEPPAPEPVEPVPAALVVPAPPRPAVPAAAPGGAVAGRWEGSLNGVIVEVSLSGPDDRVRGTFTSTFGANVQKTDLVGSFTDGALALADVGADPASAARYELALSPDGRTLQGRVSRDIGGVKPLVLRRSP